MSEANAILVPRAEGYLWVSTQTQEDKLQYRIHSARPLQLEGNLFNKYPLEAVQLTQQVSCSSGLAHGLAAVAALEDYMNVTPTYGARQLRLVLSQLGMLLSHLHHFYFQILPDYLNKEHLQKAPGNLWQVPGLRPRPVDKGDLGKEEGVLILSHFPQLLKVMGDLEKAIALVGGKYPVVMSLTIGGLTLARFKPDKVMEMLRLLEGVKSFVENVWPEDAKLLAGVMPDRVRTYEKELNLISFGSLSLGDEERNTRYFSSGISLGGKLEPINELKITEDIASTYYLEPDRKQTGQSHLYDLRKKGAESWIKAAKYEGTYMFTGPLARYLVTLFGGGNAELSSEIRRMIENLGLSLETPVTSASRLFAEVMEGRLLLKHSLDLLLQLNFREQYNRRIRPDFSKKGVGSGKIEAPAGSLYHQVYISDGRIANYRIISPMNWNFAAEDEFGKAGSVVQELNSYGKEKLSPLQISRILHSYYAQAIEGVH